MLSKGRSVARVGGWVGAGVTLAAAFAGCGVGDANYTSPPGEPVNLADLQSRPYCVGTCLPDYGSEHVDCSADAGLEFFPFDVLDAESGTITGFYAYNDGTAEYMTAGPSAYSPTQTNYGPPAVLAHGLCGPDDQVSDSYVQHLRGGLFRAWGGGMGRRLVDFVTSGGTCPAGPSRPEDPAYCPDADDQLEQAIQSGLVAPEKVAALRTNFYGMLVDLRGWDGISFWARQGPNNTAGIRVYVGDRQLDEDIAFLEERDGIAPMCRRARECGCHNHQPCTPSDGDLVGWYCWDPAQIPSLQAVYDEYDARGERSLFQQRYERCGPAACDDPNAAFAAVDPVFATPAQGGTAQCLSYNLTTDLEEYFCFDPNDPARLPPNGPERCGDGWAKGVTLSSDWQFFKVPFTDLRQEGYGKAFSKLDLSKITLVRFTWMQGWVDVWLDDVRFYREAAGRAAATR